MKHKNYKINITNEKQKDILIKAIENYENQNYASNDNDWQENVYNLLKQAKQEVK